MARNKRFKITKDAFLDALRKGDKSIGQIFREHGYSGSSQLQSWRKSDEKFTAQVDEILSMPAHQLRLKHEKYAPEVQNDAKSKFLYWYQRELDRDGACTYANVEPSQVTSWLDPGNEEYDQSFAYSWEQWQIRRRWKLEDDAQKAAIAGSENMMRYLLPVELPDKYNKARANVNVEKVSIFNAGSLAEAASFLSGLFANTPQDDSAVPAAREGLERDATGAGIAAHVAALPA